MAVNITSGNGDSNDITGGARVIVRTSAGIPYIVANNTTDTSVDIWKGNGTTPTSFTEQDAANNPDTGVAAGVAAAIDSTGVIHVVFCDTSVARYATFATSTDTWTANVIIFSAKAPTNRGASIAIDSNDIPHVAVCLAKASKGTDYDSIHYLNRIGGSWNADIQIEGSGAQKNCSFPDIAIDADNLPVIVYRNSTDGQGTGAIGNTNNATSFSLFDFTADISSNGGSSLAIDSSGNHHVAYADTSGHPHIRKHNYGDTWTTTWQTDESINGSDNSQEPSLVINGTNRYYFTESSAGGGNVAYYTDSGGSWSSRTTLETGTYSEPKAKWAYYVDRDSGGTDRGQEGTDGGRLELDYVFGDATATPDILWNSLSLAQAFIAEEPLIISQALNRGGTY